MLECDVLVTGSTGFIGEYLCERLAGSGMTVVGVDKRHAAVPYRLLHHDLTRPLAETVHARACVHLASAVGGLLYNNTRADMVEYNAAINQNVLRLCQAGNIERLVFFSSINVFESHPVFRHAPVEVFPAATAYAKSKAAGEAFFAQHFARFMAVRPTNVYGKRQARTHEAIGESHVIPDLMKKIRESDVVQVLGDGSQRRNFVHVTDIADFVARNVAGLAARSFVNLRSELTISIRELATALASFMGRNVEFEFDPSFMKFETFQIRDFDLAPAERLGWRPRIQRIDEGLNL